MINLAIEIQFVLIQADNNIISIFFRPENLNNYSSSSLL
jgi:hypothetical protein